MNGSIMGAQDCSKRVIHTSGDQMVKFNIVNFITIGLIAVLTVVAVRLAFKATGKTSPV